MIAFDSSSQGSAASGSGTSFSWSHTVAGNTLIVASYDILTNHPPSSITWGSQDLLMVTSETLSVSLGVTGVVSVWMLVSVHTGTDTITVNRIQSGTPIAAFASSYSGVGFVDSVGSNYQNTGAVLTTNATVVASNSWLVGISSFWKSTAGTPTYPSNLTDRQTFSGTFGTDFTQVFSDSNGTVGTGTQGITWTSDTGNRQTPPMGIVLAIAPTAPPASSSNFLLASY